MGKAILKTLIYADIFDYPLKIQEIHKWLIGKKATPRQLEKALEILSKKLKVKSKNHCYFLRRREDLVSKRLRRQVQSEKYFRKAKIISQFLKIVPWIKLTGVSGGLAMGNVSKKDDIDLFIITGKNRLWISRLFVLGILSLFGQRRKRQDQGRQIAGKICCNILIEEDQLIQSNKDLFTAHEVLQMQPLWHRDGIYSKYLGGNCWAFKFLPNWVATSSSELGIMNYESRIRQKNHNSVVNLLENFAKWLQLKIMNKPQGMERIEDGALYFHPEDCRLKVLNIYKTRLQRLS